VEGGHFAVICRGGQETINVSKVNLYMTRYFITHEQIAMQGKSSKGEGGAVVVAGREGYQWGDGESCMQGCRNRG